MSGTKLRAYVRLAMRRIFGRRLRREFDLSRLASAPRPSNLLLVELQRAALMQGGTTLEYDGEAVEIALGSKWTFPDWSIGQAFDELVRELEAGPVQVLTGAGLAELGVCAGRIVVRRLSAGWSTG